MRRRYEDDLFGAILKLIEQDVFIELSIYLVLDQIHDSPPHSLKNELCSKEVQNRQKHVVQSAK